MEKVRTLEFVFSNFFFNCVFIDFCAVFVFSLHRLKREKRQTEVAELEKEKQALLAGPDKDTEKTKKRLKQIQNRQFELDPQLMCTVTSERTFVNKKEVLIVCEFVVFALLFSLSVSALVLSLMNCTRDCSVFSFQLTVDEAGTGSCGGEQEE